METQKTLNSQSSLEKGEWSWRNQPSWLQIIPQSYSHQDGIVLAWTQKYWAMKQDRKTRNKPMHLSVQFSSLAQTCLTFCDSMDCSTPGLPDHHQIPETTHIHVHWVSDAIQTSHPLLFPFPLPSIFPSIRVFSNESGLRIRWPKYWSFSFNISPSNEHPGLVSFRMDWLDLLAVQGTCKSSPTSQFKSINSLALSFLHSPILTSIHDHRKNHSLD